MPFQQTSVSPISPTGSPVTNLIEGLMKGYHAAKIRQSTGRTQQLKDSLLEAEAKKYHQQMQDPYGNLPAGAVGQGVGLQRMKESGNPAYQLVKSMLEGQNKQRQSMQDSREMYARGRGFAMLPAAEKSRMVGLGVGMGMDPSEVTKELLSGKTLTQMAQEKGINLAEVQERRALSSGTVAKTRSRQAFIKEIVNLEKNVQGPIESMGRKFMGYSTNQVISAIKNKNPDEQGKMLAARALQPELATLRLAAGQGKAGIQAVMEMKRAALGNSKVFESTISPKARTAMSNYLNKWLQDAVDAYSTTIERAGEFTGKPEFKDTARRVKKSSSDRYSTFNPETGEFSDDTPR